ncbi:MAG: hypothetical protein U0793_09165 [Gemmataceae bacterium]
MSNLITPPPSDAARLAELNRRFRFRLWQMIVTMVTLILTFWFFTLGVVFGIAFPRQARGRRSGGQLAALSAAAGAPRVRRRRDAVMNGPLRDNAQRTATTELPDWRWRDLG